MRNTPRVTPLVARIWRGQPHLHHCRLRHAAHDPATLLTSGPTASAAVVAVSALPAAAAILLRRNGVEEVRLQRRLPRRHPTVGHVRAGLPCRVLERVFLRGLLPRTREELGLVPAVQDQRGRGDAGRRTDDSLLTQLPPFVSAASVSPVTPLVACALSTSALSIATFLDHFITPATPVTTAITAVSSSSRRHRRRHRADLSAQCET